MMLKLAYRMITTVAPKALWKLTYNFGWKGMLSVQRYKKRLKQGIVFPPFLYLSVTNTCNLKCTGCWVDVEAEAAFIPLDELNRLINDAKAHGNNFFGILGGEPFMHPNLLELLEQHPDCYFQIFTNGQFINEKTAAGVSTCDGWILLSRRLLAEELLERRAAVRDGEGTSGR